MKKFSKENLEQMAAQSYRVNKGYDLFELQNQNASVLHEISNMYVKKNRGFEIQQMSMPALPEPPSITIEYYSENNASGSTDDEDEEDEMELVPMGEVGSVDVEHIFENEEKSVDENNWSIMALTNK